MAQSPSLQRWRGEISADVAHIKKEVEQLPAQLDRIADRFEEALVDHASKDLAAFEAQSARIGLLEQKQSRLLGQLVIFGGISTITGSALAAALAHHFFP